MRSSLLQSIHKTLNGLVPSDASQREFQSQFLAYKRDDFCSRIHMSPGHFTASGFVRTENFEHVCLIFHPRFQKWIQPGGHLEVDDKDIWSAVKREIQEETGLSDITWDGTIRLDVHEVPKTAKHDAHLHFDLQFGCVAPFVSLEGDVRAVWVAFDSFDKNKSDASVNRFLENWK